MSRDDDLLERATRALRATPPPDEGELAQAKMRMLAAHKAATKPSRGRSLRWVLPLAAVLAAGTALAAVPNGIQRLTQAVSDLFVPKPPEQARPKRTKLAQAPAPRVSPPVPVPEPVPEPVPAAEPAPVAEPALGVAPRRVRKVREPVREPEVKPAPAPAVVAEPAAEPAAPTPELIASADLAKYRAAHKAHFQQRDFALALRNWEAYLRQYPNGTFAIEARYNRAICLLRLGRKEEARRALTPFAHGEIGRGYRQAEATKLLEALE